MKVIFNLTNSFRETKPTSIALGTFDGIHIGHQKLIRNLLYLKRKYGYKTAVYTFSRHPLKTIMPSKAPSLITGLTEKTRIFSDFKLDYIVYNHFDDEFMHLSPEQFIERLVQHFNLKAIVVGYNYRFGYKGTGDVKLLSMFAKKYDFKLIVVNPVIRNGASVSSSSIRKLIEDGNVETAQSYMKRFYMMQGKVLHGYGRGRKLGFPTANILPTSGKVLPKRGVYITVCKVLERFYWGVTNVGVNPTFQNNETLIETHLLDYNEDIYGENIKIFFVKRLRDEKKFNTSEELSKTVLNDMDNAKNFIYNIR